ncbi:MAG: proline--tRNA ligase [Rhizobiales bacterium TMED94]|nr:proline--tRNA ligase [Rhodobiaceae bacterium]RPF88360.1 MAG: proline--tRNA ligase [Rhizobiales bacterium TMED94]
MLWSNYFIPTQKEKPIDAKIPSHQLMIRSGMIKQESSGIYSWLPIGLKVLKKIETIVRDEQERAGAIEILMPTLQSSELWSESGRYDSYGDEMLRINDRHNRTLIYGPTNEEQVTEIFRKYIKSYKSLPLNLFHIQWKFRDEVRPRFGVMRGREFLMKDAYSFDLNQEEAKLSYYKMFIAYLRTFERLGLNAIPVSADSGPIGGNLSHEFSIVADTGESEIFCDKNLLEICIDENIYSSNDKIIDVVENYLNFYSATDDKHDVKKFNNLVSKDNQVTGRGIEVGHIFSFGDKYSDPMKASIIGNDGKMSNVYMGSYGIGVSRLVAAIIETSNDEKGIIWPISVAPFLVNIINLKNKDDKCMDKCIEIHNDLEKNDIDSIVDDRDESAGKKFSDSDLIGFPVTLVVGPRELENGNVEIRFRREGNNQIIPYDNVLKIIKNKLFEE